MSSADHLYIKDAAEELLLAQDLPGDVVCSQPGTASASALVELRLGEGVALTIHMNTASPPDWQEPHPEVRIVLEASLPVDRKTLQRLPYLHRIRCDSHGTSRRVLIGTQTACGTRWFRPEECSLSPTAGLVTPAFTDLPNRPIARLSAGPHTQTRTRPAPVNEEIRRLLLRLATARRGRDIALTRALIKECDAILNRRAPTPLVLRQARDSAEQWLLERSREVIKQGRKGTLVILASETAERERQKRERLKEQAAAQRQQYLTELGPALRQERFGDVRALLRAVSQLPESLPLTRAQIDLLQTARARVYSHRLGVLQDQVARRKWLKQHCPVCGARPGRECFDDIPDSPQPLWRPESWARSRARCRAGR